MTQTPKVMVKATNVWKSFGHNEVLKGINLEVKAGEVTTLLGPSGSGKSTFLRLINHLDTASAGRITVDGDLVGYREHNGALHELRPQSIAKMRSEVGMVFQQFNLFPHMSVLQNIMEAPVGVKKESKARVRERAERLLERVGLADKRNAYPGSLSGGQQQRIAIARALVNNPSILLADEPTGALDTKTSYEIMALFEKLHSDGNTIIVVTHEHDIAERAHRVITIRDGEIEKDEKIK